MKTLFKLITVLTLLPSFGVLAPDVFRGVGGGIYAQDLQLFEHTWYFVNGELEGVELLPAENSTVVLNFDTTEISMYYNYCDGNISTFILYDEVDNIFDLESDFFVFGFVECNSPWENPFIQNHTLIYGNINSGLVNNSFNYSIETVNNYFQLTVTNANGDWAVYNSVLLSTNSFHQNSFSLYPNPAKETLFITNSFQEEVQATIYDLNGKLVQSQLLKSGQTQIQVQPLLAGLYFVVFESENGERVSQKFVKN